MQTLAELPRIAPARTRLAASGASTGEQAIKAFFGGNALVAVIVLALITVFLVREGFGFFGQNLANLRLYRQAGLEYVDIIRAQADADAALSRGLSDIRLRQFREFQKAGATAEQIEASLAPFDQFASAFSDSADELNGLVSDLGDQATALKEQLFARGELLSQRHQLERAGRGAEAAAISVPEVDRAGALAAITAGTPIFEDASTTIATNSDGLLETAPVLPSAKVQQAFDQWKVRARQQVGELSATTRKLRDWSPDVPVPWYRSVSAFLFGHDWITASFWQDWYGIRPLLVGSIMVSVVALVLAVPLGISSAIYVSEIASATEKRIIKPYIEFISAIPSVVLGFFGIAVIGQAVRAVSELPIFSGVPFFPISERLNVFTAGCLLALMAVPTIFTLSEDALRNVPRGFKEASYALGANRLQTIGRVLVPASLSGIVSAILLGLGRVIGETMVVLLCAGNRIQIPDFTQGLGAFFQPVHTMTGIIAQEMGEVVRGSIHYRALFMVGLLLFAITLVINYAAQKLVVRYRMSIG